MFFVFIHLYFALQGLLLVELTKLLMLSLPHRLEPIETFLTLSNNMPLLDVRSPAEFAQGHIPGAISLPLFTNEERAVIGTLYKEQGRDAAFAHGLTLVAPKIEGFLASVAHISATHGTKNLALYCWRGGERSASMAQLFAYAGYNVHRLEGGYKSFRRFTLQFFNTPFTLIMLTGKTGCGKTEVLHQLRSMGKQVLDLEHLARHRGSAFGAQPQQDQPSCEHFENRLAFYLHKLNPQLPIWVEDESEKLGRVRLPNAFFEQMTNAKAILLDAAYDVRIERIVAEYGVLSPDILAQCLMRIQRRLGGENYKKALLLLDEGKLQELTALLLVYYDKGYNHLINKRKLAATVMLTTPEETAENLAALE